MMKKLMFAALMSASVLAAPAHAVDFTLSLTPNANGASATFDYTPLTTPTFSDRYFFTYPTNATAASAAISIQLGANNIDFTSFTLTNQATSQVFTGTTANGVMDTAMITNVPLTAGATYFLTIAGNTTGGAGYGGNLQIVNNAAVPEPATWGMMILGFGLIGAASRRSRKVTTVLA